MTNPSLNQVSSLKYSILMAYLMIWQKKFTVAGNPVYYHICLHRFVEKVI